MSKPLIVLTGPTAVGKTQLSIRLAERVNGSIISADSMQVYKYMDIGSAKIKKEEMQGIPHYLIDELMPEEPFNVVRFQELANSYIEEIYNQGRIPILTGGTGFYIQAVLYDISFTEEKREEKSEASLAYRDYLLKIKEEQGSAVLHKLLREIDENAAGDIHENNTKRIIRALEYHHLTGQKISVHNAKEREKASPYNFVYFVLNEHRDILYEKINKRVDQMMAAGLVEEVRTLKSMNYHRQMVSMQGLGYKEILDYLDGRLTLEEAVYTMKRDTRHFAKRQLTWFKREKDVIWINKPDFNDRTEKILEFMIEKIGERLKDERNIS